MWAVRTFGWTIMGIGVLSLLAIPFLAMAGRGDETPQAIGVGVVGILIGFILVRFVTKPER